MRRLTITLENYDSCKIIGSSLLRNNDELRASFSVLSRSKIEFSVEEVEGQLFDYMLDDGDRFFSLALRTEKEVKEWIHLEPFEATIKGFLKSNSTGLRLSLNRGDGYLKIDRRI